MAIVRTPTNGIDPIASPPFATQKRMILSAITREPIISSRKEIIYGPYGIGKTSFAAQYPDCVFFSTEGGLKGVEPIPARFPEAWCWQDIFDAIETLRTQNHNHKVFIIDSVDWLETLAQRKICEEYNVTSIEKVLKGYSKGLVIVAEHFRLLLTALDKLREEKQIKIVFVAHSKIKTITNPLGDNFDKYQMKLDERINSLLQEWADEILFTNFEVLVDKDNDKDRKGKAISSEKIIHAV